MRGFNQILICSMFILLAGDYSFAFSEDEISKGIDGVAEFLVERANDNFMYILQQDMKDNSLLECYMPITYKYASSNNLQLLLQSSKNIWAQSVRKDLENFGARLIIKEINPDAFSRWAKNMDDKYIEELQKVTIVIDGKSYPVDQLPIDASPELKASVNNFYNDYLNGRSKLDAIIAGIANSQKFHTCGISSVYGSASAVLPNLKDAITSFQKQMEKNKSINVVVVDDGQSADTSFYKSLLSLESLNKSLNDLKNKIDAIPNDGSLFNKMFQIDQLIREEIASDANPLKTITDLHEYNRFSKYALSFAMLSDTEDPAQAKAIMQQLAMPPVSFGIKREPDNKKLMITAYFGLQAGAQSGAGGFGGIMAPVGVEYSSGLKNGGVVSVMLAPFDFAHPVNQIINNNNGASTFNEIVNPGVYVSYGIKK